LKNYTFKVLYRNCKNGVLRKGTVMAEDYEKACYIAAKSFKIVVEVVKPVVEEVGPKPVSGLGNFWR
jgi:isocitrate dehydrogenase kinase/phosphatase